MRLRDDLGELTYCLNVHPAETWAETRAAIEGPLAAVKAAVSPDAPFAAGLRLSARCVAELDAAGGPSALKAVLDAGDLRAVTVNGFPYGRFHGAPVKQAVYEPDWLAPERLDYTLRLARIMAAVAPGDGPVSLSTVPGGYRPKTRGREADVADALLRAAAGLARLADETGATVTLAIEPEPCCLLETTDEAAAFFETWLLTDAAAARLADLAGLTRAAAAAALPRHLGLCYDVCHAAVEFEDAAQGLNRLAAAGVPVHKLQLSAALRLPRADSAARAALAAFDEPVYLHQVVARRPGGALTRMFDLAEALSRGDAAAEEWRVHFHVPVFADDLGAFATTRDFLEDVLAIHARAPIAPHLEVETYTWDVLPPELRRDGLVASIAREIGWVRERLQA
jgi:hypothetical protein